MNDSEAIRFYCGVGEQQWNHHPVAPGSYACISPVYGNSTETRQENRVASPPETLIIQDSGAFSDGPEQRLSYEAALDRQIVHAEKFGYVSQITHRASYDLLIDEKWQNGRRYKARWTEQDAKVAINRTVNAARYLSLKTGPARILSAQGVSARQYLSCAEQIVPLLSDGDIFGLGGWCITGKLPSQMMPVFRETMQPIRPARGRWGYAIWTDTSYTVPPVEKRGLHRMQHVRLTREWLADFRTREPHCYQAIKDTPHYQQLSWEDAA